MVSKSSFVTKRTEQLVNSMKLKNTGWISGKVNVKDDMQVQMILLVNIQDEWAKWSIADLQTVANPDKRQKKIRGLKEENVQLLAAKTGLKLKKIKLA